MTVVQDLPSAPLERDTPFSRAGTTVPDVTIGPRKFIACVFMAGCAATGTLTAISPADAAALTTVATEPSTLPAVPAQQSAPFGDQIAIPRLLERLRRTSGLSWGDIARAIGVSRRTIHNWLGGARVAGVHLGRLLELNRVVELLSTGVSERTRTVLLQPGAHGRSIIDELATMARPARRIPLSTVSVGDQIGPTSDEADVPPTRDLRRSSLRGGVMPRRQQNES